MDEVKVNLTEKAAPTPTKQGKTAKPTLRVHKFLRNAKLPTVAHPGEDAGYDLYAAEDKLIVPGAMKQIRTGIGIQFVPKRAGIIKDRSSRANGRGVTTGGVIDAGYRGEIIIFFENRNVSALQIKEGEKIAQLIPIPVETDWDIVEADSLDESARQDQGFGSSGK
jgi:dUTP pyrophosphatase